VGASLQITVAVGLGVNAQVFVSNDTFSYPVSPLITSVSGCTNIGSTTTICSTEGWTVANPVLLTVTGQYFVRSPDFD